MSVNIWDAESQEVKKVAGNANINDGAISENSTWSSKKIDDEFSAVNVNLGELEGALEDKADKTEVNNMLAKYPNATYYATAATQKLDCNNIVDRVCLVTASFTGFEALHYPAKELLFIFTTKNDSGDGMQKAISWSTQREWNRAMQNGTWSAWQELATMDKVVTKADSMLKRAYYHAYSSETIHITTGHAANVLIMGTQSGSQFVLLGTWYSDRHLFLKVAGECTYTISNNDGEGFDITMANGEYYAIVFKY